MLAVWLSGCRDAPASVDDNALWPAALGAPAAAVQSIERLHNHGFLVGYDPARRRAAWVAYGVSPVTAYQAMPRPEFIPDPRLAAAPALSPYAGPDYDRGHLAPNYAISQLYGRQGQRESFYYSNVAPQRARLNQLLWQRLEEVEVDAIAPRVDRLWVIVGPVAADAAAVPSAFFRIWAAQTPDHGWQSLAFLLPQRVRGDERLGDYVVSIDRVEAATGLDFFSGLDPAREQELERAPAPLSTFDFVRSACMPARYAARWQGRDGVQLQFDRCGANR